MDGWVVVEGRKWKGKRGRERVGKQRGKRSRRQWKRERVTELLIVGWWVGANLPRLNNGCTEKSFCPLIKQFHQYLIRVCPINRVTVSYTTTIDPVVQ